MRVRVRVWVGVEPQSGQPQYRPKEAGLCWVFGLFSPLGMLSAGSCALCDSDLLVSELEVNFFFLPVCNFCAK